MHEHTAPPISRRIPLPTEPALGPIGSERFISIDVLRGFALFGVLAANVFSGFALVMAVFHDPRVHGGFTGADFYVWLFMYLLVDMKMITIFSMLFGAGMLVLTERVQSRGGSPAAVYYRRLGWLALFGLLHAYLLWFGDILFIYAIGGLLLYPLRRLQPFLLIAIGVALTLVEIAIMSGFGWLFHFMEQAHSGSDPNLASFGAEWPEIAASFSPPAETVADEVRIRGSDPGELFFWNIAQSAKFHVFLLPFMIFWRILGVMLIGMGLMKLGVLTAVRSKAAYAGLAAFGYVIGLSICGLGAHLLVKNDFDPVFNFKWGMHFNYVGSVFVALGHTGLIMLICKCGWLKAVQHGLAAAGRMAFTNYLSQTLICTLVFSAYGLGFFGQWSRSELSLFIIAVAAIQITWSVLWLRRFAIGPFEWVWRSLTYLRPVPLRRPE